MDYTGIGTKLSGETVEPPKTGNNSLHNLMLVIGALCLIVTGLAAVKLSGLNRRKDD